jgi:hypothetical protein
VFRGGKTINVTNKNQLFSKIPELVQAMVNEIAGGVTPAQTNPTNNSTQQYDPESDFKAELMEGGKSVRITGYRGEKWNVRIPPQIQGIPVTHIGKNAFAKTNIASVVIPDGVISIGDYAFQSCERLVSVTIPNGVTSIGSFAFCGCNSLTSVTIPNSVKDIGDGAFAVCTSLTTINVANDNSSYTAINGILYNKDRSVLHTYPAGKKGSFIIPNGVSIIDVEAFGGCTSLTSVTIPNSVINIYPSAFRGCTSLIDINIPNSVTNIQNAVFCGCTSLTSITIPNSIIGIGHYAFDNCTSLTLVTFQGTIPNYFFTDPTFDGNLREVFYSGNENGTPGTYRTTNPGKNAVWRKL